MDKKLYVCPEAEILEIETQGFLASSLGGQNDDTILNGDDDNKYGGDDFDPSKF